MLQVQFTPKTSAQELMKSDDVGEVLKGFVQLLIQMKKDKHAHESIITESMNIRNSNLEKIIEDTQENPKA